MFGGFQLSVDGKLVGPTRTRKENNLIAILALQRESPMGRDQLATTLWPDSSLERALANLRRSLAEVRELLGPHNHVLSKGHGPVTLNVREVACDVLRFDELVRTKSEDALKEAVELYKGQLLPEIHEEWASSARLSRQIACTEAIRTLSQFLTASDAARYLSLAVSIDPADEQSLRQLMSTLVRAGRRSQALEEYRVHERRLQRQFGWGPSAETTALFDRIYSRPRAPSSELPATGQAGTKQLLGRATEIEQIMDALRSSRFVTILGPPGIGKTVVAQAAAAKLLELETLQFLSLEIAEAEDASSISELAERSWGLQGSESSFDKVRKFLEGQEALVFIDGIERTGRLMPDEISQLAEAVPNVRFLVTGWQETLVPGEAAIQLGPLETSSSEESEPSTAAVLFEQAAQVVDRNFTLNAKTIHLVEQICRLLDGMPFAIELAASWVGAIPLDKIPQLFLSKTSAGEESQSESSSVRSTLDLMFDSLGPTEAKILTGLVAFPDGCTFEGIHAVSQYPEFELARILRQLVGHSLVHFDFHTARYRTLKIVKDRCRVRFPGFSQQAAVADYLWSLVTRGLDNGDTLFDNYADDWMLSERENFQFFIDWWRERDSYRSVVAEFAMYAYQVWQPPEIGVWLDRFKSPDSMPGDSEPFIRYMIAIFALWQSHAQCFDLLNESVQVSRLWGTRLWEAASWSGIAAWHEHQHQHSKCASAEVNVQAALKPLNLSYYPYHSQGIQFSREHFAGDPGGLVRLRKLLEDGNNRRDWRIRYASLRGLGGIALGNEDYLSLSSWSRELAAIAEIHVRHEYTNILRWQTIAAIGCGDLDSAKIFANRCIEVAQERKTRDREASARMQLADIAELEQDFDEANRQLTLAGQIFERISRYRLLCICVIRRANLLESRSKRTDQISLILWAKALSDSYEFVLGEKFETQLQLLIDGLNVSGRKSM